MQGSMALPQRTKRGGPTLEEAGEIESRKLAFLAALPSLGVTAAAREAGVAEFTPCKWYANDAKFRAAWDALEPLTARRLEAIADAVERLAANADARERVHRRTLDQLRAAERELDALRGAR